MKRDRFQYYPTLLARCPFCGERLKMSNWSINPIYAQLRTDPDVNVFCATPLCGTLVLFSLEGREPLERTWPF